jgi:hypothetical protein
MALPATDNFNRANANPIGGNWTTGFNGIALKLLSNGCMSSETGGARDNAYWNADAFDSDHYSQIKIAALNGTSLAQGPTVRVQSGAQTFYQANCSTTTISLRKFVAGTITTIGEDKAIAVAAGDIIRLAVFGSVLEVSLNGIVVRTGQDASIPSGGAPGIHITGNANTIVDDWEGGNVYYSGTAGLTGTATESITEADIV